MNQYNKIIEFLDSIEKDKNMFLSGYLHGENEKEFINNIKICSNILVKIADDNIKDILKKFVASVVNHKNYKIYQDAKEKDEIKNKKRQEQLEKQKCAKSDAEYKADLLDNCMYDGDLYKVKEIFCKNSELFQKYRYKTYEKYQLKIPIINFILDKNINNLVHFTDIRNLNNILANGLLSRKNLIERNIQFYYSDKDRFDNKLDCISLSIEYPNDKMLKNKINNCPEKHFCILVLDAKKILLNDNPKYYLYINAATKNAAWWLQSETLSDTKYLFNMYSSKIINNEKTVLRNEKLPIFLPTDSQAEILIKDEIAIDCVKKVHFNSKQDLDYYLSLDDNNQMKETLFEIDNFYFKNREEVNWEECCGK